MEQHSPSEEEITIDETLEEEEVTKKKISHQEDINAKLTNIPREIGLVAQVS